MWILQQQNNPAGWQETWKKRVGKGNKRQEGTYRHAFPSKGCRETERTERGVSNSVPHRAEDSGQQRGALGSQSWQKVFVKLNQPKQSPGSCHRPSCPGRLMQSSNQAEQWWSTEPFLTWARRGHHSNTDSRRGAGQDRHIQQAAGGEGSMAKAPAGHTGLLSELRRGVCAWESEQQARPLFLCPFMGG